MAKGCIVLADDLAGCSVALSKGVGGGLGKFERGIELLVPCCSTWNTQKCPSSLNRSVRWSNGGDWMVSSTSRDNWGSRKSLVIILGGQKTNAIERKMVKKVWYFFLVFPMSPGIVLTSTGCLVVERVEVLFNLGSYLFFGGTGGGCSRLYYGALSDAELDVELSSRCWQ
jgi:hypothetical protein